ncbi:uncharacterized protein MONOS_17391 [Monocercomonoides exilis]|uniref:uncharacterized protein n=1 Tax=Monocercomonoides exilis TaxID=2049356 RepID=UPI00355A5AEE|nr:hypothetical protein MONOS_17391 [Monocercomonoides exilis]
MASTSVFDDQYNYLKFQRRFPTGIPLPFHPMDLNQLHRKLLSPDASRDEGDETITLPSLSETMNPLSSEKYQKKNLIPTSVFETLPLELQDRICSAKSSEVKFSLKDINVIVQKAIRQTEEETSQKAFEEMNVRLRECEVHYMKIIEELKKDKNESKTRQYIS